MEENRNAFQKAQLRRWVWQWVGGGCMCVCRAAWICYRKKDPFLNFWILYFNFKKSCKINCLRWEEQGYWTTKWSSLATQKDPLYWRVEEDGERRELYLLMIVTRLTLAGQCYSYRKSWAIISVMEKNKINNEILILIPEGGVTFSPPWCPNIGINLIGEQI